MVNPELYIECLYIPNFHRTPASHAASPLSQGWELSLQLLLDAAAQKLQLNAIIYSAAISGHVMFFWGSWMLEG